MMTKEQRDELRRLMEAASPGPWYFVSPLGVELETLVFNNEDEDVPVLSPKEIGDDACTANWDFVASARNLCGEILDDYESLAKAIETHRSQKADNRCIEDDDRLYEALGDGIKCDRHVGDKTAMLANCARFIDRRCKGGKWPTYVELEAKLDALAKAAKKFLPTCCGAGQVDAINICSRCAALRDALGMPRKDY